MYGFRKVYQLNLSYDDTIQRRTVWHFKHYSFQKNSPEKLYDIKRRANNKSDQESPQQEYTKVDNRRTEYLVTNASNHRFETELKNIKQRLLQEDKMRQDLLNQVLYLNKLQTNQREVSIYNSDYTVCANYIFFIS